jgi:hypothetical protein
MLADLGFTKSHCDSSSSWAMMLAMPSAPASRAAPRVRAVTGTPSSVILSTCKVAATLKTG